MTSNNDPAGWPYPVSDFKCHLCGNCCRGDGFVEMTKSDIKRIAAHLELTRETFLDRYAQYDRDSRHWHLVDQDDEEQSCIFLENNRCAINDVKPKQCRDFPSRWRPENILDFCEGWRAAAGLSPANKSNMTEE